MKKIKIFEFFSGIGSQLKALKNISKKLNINVSSAGACDFYIDAIVSYMAINYGKLDPENILSKEDIIAKLSKYNLSNNSKDIVSEKYFNRLNEEKLRNLFSYLYSFINNNYFKNRYKKLNERERERIWY
ncbi:Uncharacterised protein [Mycoplasmopsis maculosa]|uniref:Uncharacterized protein n=1 Tax=Mycoplasmopsis maculosa TaxID=114885 RepID=A0A449B4K8_9BACT|nr:DNA methyltransferase [Mycoplasmopsis maculosa]VEU75543.1 Uncharacterised protein [Mycoplasmopsis maculosa]